jgi:hypothetical protein
MPPLAKSQLKADERKDDLGSFTDLSFAALLTKIWRWGTERSKTDRKRKRLNLAKFRTKKLFKIILCKLK